MNKRVVVLRPDGIQQIVGYIKDDGTPPVILSEDPFISLVKVTHHAAFYKPPMALTSYTSMHKEQK